MRYEVFIQPTAVAEIEDTYAFLVGISPERAEAWMGGLADALATLERMPLRCSLASEGAGLPYPVRQLLYERHRILFTVSGRDVHVLHLRHMRRDRRLP